MKDVILLPNTKMTSVPHGAIREELHVRNFVASAVEIKGEMEEAEIRTIFDNLLTSKLPTVVGHKFQFVRTVGNQIIEPKVDHPWHGKMVKHISGQGPVYLRSAKNFHMGTGRRRLWLRFRCCVSSDARLKFVFTHAGIC